MMKQLVKKVLFECMSFTIINQTSDAIICSVALMRDVSVLNGQGE